MFPLYLFQIDAQGNVTACFYDHHVSKTTPVMNDFIEENRPVHVSLHPMIQLRSTGYESSIRTLTVHYNGKVTHRFGSNAAYSWKMVRQSYA